MMLIIIAIIFCLSIFGLMLGVKFFTLTPIRIVTLIILLAVNLSSFIYIIKILTQHTHDHHVAINTSVAVPVAPANNISPHNNTKVTNTIIIPKNMQPAPIWVHTALIGTANHPTVDGGILNTTDGKPLFTPKFTSKSAVIENATTNATNLNDHWAVSHRIRTVLDKAIATGQLSYVLSQAAQQHLPASVALVPIIESNYHNQALSPKGAAGAWQLMAATAKENGLNPTQRQDFAPATATALTILTQLHQHFGNWNLAYAAYNAGSGRVAKALMENPHAQTINQLDLPLETKNYVAQLHLASEVISHAA